MANRMPQPGMPVGGPGPQQQQSGTPTLNLLLGHDQGQQQQGQIRPQMGPGQQGPMPPQQQQMGQRPQMPPQQQQMGQQQPGQQQPRMAMPPGPVIWKGELNWPDKTNTPQHGQMNTINCQVTPYQTSAQVNHN